MIDYLMIIVVPPVLPSGPWPPWMCLAYLYLVASLPWTAYAANRQLKMSDDMVRFMTCILINMAIWPLAIVIAALRGLFKS